MTDGGHSKRRKDRIARNEAVFREVNERVREVRGADADMIDFLCECGDDGCVETVAVTRQEYEDARADPALFVVCPDHSTSDVEDVVAATGRFHVVRKHEEEQEIARSTDPRA